MASHLRSVSATVVLIRNLVDKAEIRAKVVEAVREWLARTGDQPGEQRG
jgi:hypothetical protein